MSICAAVGRTPARGIEITLPVGLYEPLILNEDNLVTYLEFGSNLSDSSSVGVTAAEVGSGGSYVPAIVDDVGSGNLAFRTNGTCHVAITHNTAYETDPGGIDVPIVKSEILFSGHALIHDLVNGTNIFSKADNPANWEDLWYVYADANGSVHLRARTPFREVKIDTPAGVVVEGVKFHIGIFFGLGGLGLVIDGKMANEGDKNILHTFGWDYRERDVRFTNDSAIRLGATGTSGNSDITFDEVAVFVNGVADDSFDAIVASGKSLAYCQSLAQASGAAIADPIWGITIDDVSTAGAIQGAIDALTPGGGTVRLATNTYNITADLFLKDNVKLDLNGSTLNLSEGVNILFPAQVITDLTANDPGGTFAAGQMTYSITNGLSGTQALAFRSTTDFQSLWQVSGSPISDPNWQKAEIIPIASRTAGLINTDRPAYWQFTAAERSAIRATTLTKHVSIRNGTIQRTQVSGTFQRIVDLNWGIDLKLVDVTIHELGTSGDKWASQFTGIIDAQFINCQFITESEFTAPGVLNYGLNIDGCRDFIAQSCLCDSAGGHHPLTHGGGPLLGAGDRWMFSLRVELYNIECWQDNDAFSVWPFDSHGAPTESRWLFIHCSNGGGPLSGGWRNELGFVTSTLAGRNGGVSIHDGMGECYWHDFTFPTGKTMTAWFESEGSRGMKNNRLVRIDRDTSIAVGSGPDVTPEGNTYISVDGPLPSDA